MGQKWWFLGSFMSAVTIYSYSQKENLQIKQTMIYVFKHLEVPVQNFERIINPN